MHHRYFIIIISLFLFACNERTEKNNVPNAQLKDKKNIPSNYFMHEIELINDIGNIKVCVPKNLDTIYEWNKNDHDCFYNVQMYRIADSNYSLIKETETCTEFSAPDSLYQLTVIHQIYPCIEYLYKDLDIIFEELYAEQTKNSYVEILLNETQTINGRKFIIVAKKFNLWQNEKEQIIVNAITPINAVPITFSYECWSSNCGDFLNIALQSIKTIEIKEKPLSYKSVCLTLRHL